MDRGEVTLTVGGSLRIETQPAFLHCESFVMILFMTYARSFNVVKSTNIRRQFSVNPHCLPPSGLRFKK